jgi:alpha-methylacyl-CoA racemase
MTGPLAGVRIIELAALGPAPFAGMMLADAGADIILIDRSDRAQYPASTAPNPDLLSRGRRSIAVDLKNPASIALVLDLLERADGVIEGFRPGVAERLGLGPAACLARNERLVYGRMTGWGQDGPLAQMGGHDINFIALAGALEPIGRKGSAPVPPLNLVADFGGGGMMMAFGMLAALYEAQRTGRGQVVDAAMVDGVALLMTMTYGLQARGLWRDERGTNILDTGAHFYEVYETLDGKYVAVGAVEPKFYENLLRQLGLDASTLPSQWDREGWPLMKERFADIFKTRSRDEWEKVFIGIDACVAPVLSPTEALDHPHHRSRDTFTEVADLMQPAPAPRFARTPTTVRRPPPNPGQHADEALLDWGFSAHQISGLRASGAMR